MTRWHNDEVMAEIACPASIPRVSKKTSFGALPRLFSSCPCMFVVYCTALVPLAPPPPAKVSAPRGKCFGRWGVFQRVLCFWLDDVCSQRANS